MPAAGRSEILISTWSDGVFVLSEGGRSQELAGRAVGTLAPDGQGGALGIVDGRTLARRSPGGQWSELGTAALPLECCLAVGGVIYAGTEGAHLLRLRGEGDFERVAGFDATEGRERWFAGSAIVDGQRVGPPLSVRALAGSGDGTLLLAAAHVGGIVRSVDGGQAWHPAVPIEWDVHEVCVHRDDPSLAIAACGAGLGVSTDGGATWALEEVSPELTYCSAVAFTGTDLLVSVSSDHFAPHGLLFRRPIASPGTLEAVGGGLPDRLAGIVDTRCIAARGSELVVVAQGGDVYRSSDGGRRWTRVQAGIPQPSSALIPCITD